MKRLNFSKGAFFSFFLSVICGVLFIICMMHIQGYNHPSKLNMITSETLKTGQYFSGDITTCVIIPPESPNAPPLGVSYGFIPSKGPQYSYDTYTIPVADGRFIRLWINGKEDLENMEKLVHGENISIPFIGKVVEFESTDQNWFSRIPDFDTANLIEGYVIQKTDIEAEKFWAVTLFWTMLLSWLYFQSCGGISIRESSYNFSNQKKTYNLYDIDGEILYLKNRLSACADMEKSYKRKLPIGILLCTLGLYLTFIPIPALFIRIIGLVIFFYGIHDLWLSFLNSDAGLSVRISGFLGVETIQQKKLKLLSEINTLEEKRGTEEN